VSNIKPGGSSYIFLFQITCSRNVVSKWHCCQEQHSAGNKGNVAKLLFPWQRLPFP